mgnify:FL=1
MKAIVIFILFCAAIGWFAGFLQYNSIMPSSVEKQHDEIVSYIKNEIKKCKSGSNKFLNDLKTCPATPQKIISAILVIHKDSLNPFTFNENILPKKSPGLFRENKSNNKDDDRGFINLNYLDSELIIKSCFRKPCSKEENRLQDIIEVK